MSSRFLMACIALFLSFASSADEVTAQIDTDDFACPNSRIIGEALITDVCWDALFPMYIGGAKFGGRSSDAPSSRNKKSLCFCEGDILKGEMPLAGISVGLYLPKYLVTVTKRPYCFPELNGTVIGENLGLTSRFNVGNQSTTASFKQSTNTQSDYTWHLAALPLAKMLNLINVPGCFQDGYSSFDIMWMSEVLPMWYDPELAFYVAPESMLFSTPLALPGVLADCIAASASDPMDTIFFAAGCWGSMYPISSSSASNPDKVAVKSLIASRALFFLARIGILNETVGEDAMCERQKMPLLTKSQYRFQQLWPMSESESVDVSCNDSENCDSSSKLTTIGPSQGDDSNALSISNIKMNSVNSTCTHPIGQSTYAWGIWRGAKQQDHASYLIWQWQDCCADLLTE